MGVQEGALAAPAQLDRDVNDQTLCGGLRMRKINWYLLAVAAGVAAYAVYCIAVDDLALLYDYWHGSKHRRFRILHLHGWWTLAGSACLLLGAAGAALRSGVLQNAKTPAPTLNRLANGLIAIGGLFSLGVYLLTQWLI